MKRFAGRWLSGAAKILSISSSNFGLSFDGNPVNYELGLRENLNGEESLSMSFHVEDGDDDLSYVLFLNEDGTLSLCEEDDSGALELVKTLQKAA